MIATIIKTLEIILNLIKIAEIVQNEGTFLDIFLCKIKNKNWNKLLHNSCKLTYSHSKIFIKQKSKTF